VTAEVEPATRRCAWCHDPMDDTTRRRKHAVTCSNRCRKALSREAKRHRGSNSIQSGSVTTGDAPYVEPPRPGETDSYGAWLAGERFRAQLAHHVATSQPLTDQEKELLSRQRRNPGPLLPELAQLQIDRAREQQRRELAEYASHQPIKVEDRLDPSSQGSVARRARESRRLNQPVDPHLSVLRPGRQSGQRFWYDDNQCIDAPWSRGRW
jgi:predicted nucleic acid-binding Zn ribbon protein